MEDFSIACHVVKTNEKFVFLEDSRKLVISPRLWIQYSIYRKNIEKVKFNNDNVLALEKMLARISMEKYINDSVSEIKNYILHPDRDISSKSETIVDIKNKISVYKQDLLRH